MALQVAVLWGGCQLYVACLLLLSLFPLSDGTFEMEEDAAESGKSNYVNLKRVVWHKSFYELLGSIRELSKVGYCIECADEVTRRIFPAILILSADYEEQYG